MSVEDASWFCFFLLNVMHEIQKAYFCGLDSCSNLLGFVTTFCSFVFQVMYLEVLKIPGTAGSLWGSSVVC